jgi:hypothetical protein
MEPWIERSEQTRRHFLTSRLSGLGGLALASLLARDGVFAADNASGAADTVTGFKESMDGATEGASRPHHHPPRAQRCIFVFLMGGPSQMDLYDPKPKLVEFHGTAPPREIVGETRFAFLQRESATLMGSPRRFQASGECGMELSELLPHLAKCADDIALVRSAHTDSFNHAPAELLAAAGSQVVGRPSIGAWLNYGLGSETENLPGYVVLSSGRVPQPDPYHWSHGFLPPRFQGVPFRSTGTPILNLQPRIELPDRLARAQQSALRDLNQMRLDQVQDPEIAGRIASYEMAFRMQTSAPELVDLSSETVATRTRYGLDRDEGPLLPHGSRGGGQGMFHTFATHCLLARRLVERGVRFVSLIHTSWDQHDDLDRQLDFNCRMADQPLAALVRDLKTRGLLDSTLVVCASEFGRTPLGENRPEWERATGRDHHPEAFSLWLAGGGIRGGRVLGRTDELGWKVVQSPVHIHDLHATILHLFGIDHKRLTYRYQGRDFRLTDVHGRLVAELIQ